jgi:hypothetical protein
MNGGGTPIDTSAFATTGSNTFRGNQTVTGSLFTSGSNTLVGVTTLTGSLLVTGSTTQTGNNTLVGNTTLSGSIIISGSTGPGAATASVQIYGDIRQSGYHRFDPVNTNIDTSISASYIYVSGSTNDLYFSQNGDGYSNVTRLRWLEGNLYTGLLNGGLITATVGSTTYQISSGSGIIVNLNASLTANPYPTVQYVQWGNLSASIAPLTASYQQAFVSIDSTGNIYQQGTPYAAGQYDTEINIGVVLFQNGSTINGVKTQPSTAYGFEQQQNIFNRAFGPLKLSGYTLAPSGSSTGSLIVASGTAYAPGSNYTINPNSPSYTIDSGTNISKIFRYRQSGSTWVYDTNGGAGYTSIDPTRYSDNGVLTAVPGGGSNREFSIQRVFYFPNSVAKAIVVYYGNATYASLTEATSNISFEPFVEAPNTAANAIYLGAIIVRNNANFTVTDSYVIQAGGLFRGVGGAGGGGSVVTQTLAGLSDVAISAPTNGQALVYDTTAAKWQNKSSISASISGNATTATTAATASSADNFTVRGTLTAQTIVVQTITSSIDFVTGSTRFGSLSTNTHQFTGSVSISGSGATNALDVNGTAKVQTSLEIVSGSGLLLGGLVALGYPAGSTLEIGKASGWSDVRMFTGGVFKYSQTPTLTTITNTTINLETTTVQLAGVNALTYSGTDIRIGSVATGFNTLSMYVSGSEKARITSAGRLLLGTITEGVDLLDVNGTAKVNGNLTVTGSIIATQGITASLQGTSSWAQNAVTSSYIIQAVSASFASTASFAPLYVLNSQTSSFVQNSQTASMTVATASFATSSLSSSFASTASFAPLYVLNSQTSSFVQNSQTSSFVTNAQTSSFVLNSQTASMTVASASQAATASSADNFTVRGTLTAQTIVAQTITSSTDFVTGSTRFGSLSSNTHQFTGSVGITGSLTINGSNTIITTGAYSISHQRSGTTGLAQQMTNDGNTLYLGVQSSSPGIFLFANGSLGYATLFGSGGNYATQFATNNIIRQTIFAGGNVLLHNGGTPIDEGYKLDVSGSGRFTNNVNVTGSITATTGFTGSLFGTSSWAQNAVTSSYILNAVSSSFAATASYILQAVSASFATTASFAPNYVLTSATSSMLAPYVLNSQTSSFVTNAQTSSFVQNSQTSSFVLNSQTSSMSVLSASYASGSTSASFASNGGVTQIIAGTNITISPTNGLGAVTINSSGGGGASFPYTGSAIITGSLIVTGSTTSTLGFTGSLFGTSSFTLNIDGGFY